MPRIVDSDKKILFPLFALILLAAFVAALPFRDIFGQEIRNAFFAREMLGNGLSLIPHVLGKPYPDYPPLYFWLEVLFSLPAGHVSNLSAVAPSSFSALGLLFLAFFFGREITPRVGWLSALLLATVPDFWIEAGTASIDMLLAFHVCAALLCLYFREKWKDSGKKILLSMAVPLFIFLAFFTKGPIGLVLPAAAWGGYLLMEKRGKSFFLFTLFMAGMASLCVGSELMFVWKNGGSELVRKVIRMQVTGRLGEESTHPFYYYIFCILGSGGIWFLFCSPLWLRSVSRIRHQGWTSGLRGILPVQPILRLSLAWFFSTFAIFSLASTRHSRYLLPLYPALAVLLAYTVEQILQKDAPLFPRAWKYSLNALTGIVLASGIGYAFFYPNRVVVPAILIIIWGAMVSAGVIALRTLDRNGTRIVGQILLFLVTALYGTNLLYFSGISRNVSGRDFTEAVESKSDLRLPAVMYRISSDGDGLKFAYYSRRNPSELRFAGDDEELKTIPPPYLLVVHHKDEAKLEKAVGNRTLEPVTQGTIRSNRFSAYIVKNK
jgi:4-amino-4-deoxy-L-arabinose transferase-like glycosyltransferase